ncbi:MAG: DNA repair protein RecO [Deltaproteobacteria bacterium]|nr:DNA repair protein RecO [Deltaproteobacteria bacterium]
MEGIIVKTHPSGESDLVIRVVTDLHGKLAIFAPHARKSKRRFGTKMDVLDYGTFETKQGRGTLATLTAFNPISSFPNIRSDLDRLSSASTILEAFDLLLPEQGQEAGETFHVLLLALKSLEKSEGTKQILRICFMTLATLLNITGFETNQVGGRASSNNLLKILDQIEALAERKLFTRTALEKILEKLKREESLSRS